MASSLPPVKAAAFTFYQSLVSQADTDIFKTSVTLAAGDVKISKDGGAFNNVATLPTEIGTSGVLSCPLSASEMDADVVVVRFSDAAGAEWQDAMATIWTAAQTLDMTDGVVDGISAVKPDHKPTIAPTGEATANVTMWKGDPPNDLQEGTGLVQVYGSGGTMSASNEVLTTLASMITTDGPPGEEEYLYTAKALENAPSLTAQEVRDAMKLAPTAGDPAAGSVDKHLDDILEDTGTTLPATLALLATSAALAVVDANVDAIKVITDQIDVTAVTQVAASSAGHLTITAALTFNESVTGLTIPATWVTALWTLKADASKPDTAALVQLRETNPAALTDGLVRLNGAAVASPLTAASGALTVTQASGRIGIYLTDELTALLDDATGLGWDVKFINAAGDSSGSSGTADVVLTETKATA